MKRWVEEYGVRLENLGITHNPFELRAIPEEKLVKVFVDREEEMRRIVSIIEGRPNALAYGYFGAGKTAFLKYVLHDLSTLRKPTVAAAYTAFTGTSETDFAHTVAFAVSKMFTAESERARKLHARLSGAEIEKRRERGIEKVIKYVNVSGETHTTQLLPVHVKSELEEILREMSKRYRILIGVDEIDKMNPRDFNMLIKRVRDILGYDASFIFTGSYTFMSRAAEIVSTQFGAFDVKTELPPMEDDHLVALAERYCKLAGQVPFERAALEHLADFSFGVPRAMVRLCREAIECAASDGLSTIGEKHLSKILRESGRTIFEGLTPAQRKVAHKIYALGGELKAVTRDLAKGKFKMDQSAVYHHIDELRSKDALIETGQNDERVWRLNPAVSTYLGKTGLTLPTNKFGGFSDSRPRGLPRGVPNRPLLLSSGDLEIPLMIRP